MHGKTRPISPFSPLRPRRTTNKRPLLLAQHSGSTYITTISVAYLWDRLILSTGWTATSRRRHSANSDVQASRWDETETAQDVGLVNVVRFVRARMRVGEYGRRWMAEGQRVAEVENAVRQTIVSLAPAHGESHERHEVCCDTRERLYRLSNK